MRTSSLCIGAAATVLIGLANAGCVNPCGSNKCLGALGVDQEAGEAFCSSWLSLAPATTTVTEIETVTSTIIGHETSLSTLTVTTATITEYVVPL